MHTGIRYVSFINSSRRSRCLAERESAHTERYTFMERYRPDLIKASGPVCVCPPTPLPRLWGQNGSKYPPRGYYFITRVIQCTSSGFHTTGGQYRRLTFYIYINTFPRDLKKRMTEVPQNVVKFAPCGILDVLKRCLKGLSTTTGWNWEGEGGGQDG